MATILLQAAGGLVGGALGGPFGAILGRAAGALAGASLDAALFGGTTRNEGARLAGNRIMDADEGAGMAQVYGTARVAGQVIWATRFEETRQTARRGGKGGPPRSETTSYAYAANFAVALCEGPIAGIRRLWADGEEIDVTTIVHRLHRGGETQAPDPLIEARQGAGNAPAYRGTAYLVFERMPLARWGNRLPQISAEVLRPVGRLETLVRAVTIIPGASEHGLDPRPVRERVADGEDAHPNRHVAHAASDWTASIDELGALCPSLERAALVVSWFGDDLRAGTCRLRPGVETRTRDEDETWFAGGVGRGGAHLVSRHAGGPAFGGTPSDAGVLRSIADLKARGLKVTYYPFVLMDVPAGSGRPDPYGGAEQAAYPWRGRITSARAPGLAGSAQGTDAVRAEVSAFLGTATPGEFTTAGGRVVYHGRDGWSYRRMIFHQAHLAALGGADAFLIGSELRGLTQLRDAAGRFPFVDALIEIARGVRSILPHAVLTYAADWSEYFGHRPPDGSGDVFYNLDPLWAEAAIDVVGIDNYLPLADARAEGGEDRDGALSPHDPDALRAGMNGGEHYDWFYASDADRASGRRTPITDGAAGKPWVFRGKDIRSWWENPHFDRRGGVESGMPSPWRPASKPIWFTELGCPAVDHGANQPNVFVDPKSSESLLPHHAAGGRDDLMQRRFLEVQLGRLDPASAAFEEALNPVSPVYGERMIASDAIHVWTWDARPYPAFPARGDVWSDGGNWRLGHWLTGRLGTAPGDALFAAILQRHGVRDAATQGVEGSLAGVVLPGPGTAREALDGLMRLTGTAVRASGGRLVFATPAAFGRPLALDAFVEEEGPLVERRRAEAGELPDEIALAYLDEGRACQPAERAASAATAGTPRRERVDLPVVLDEEAAGAFARGMLAETLGSRETARFTLSPARLDLEPGDSVTLAGHSGRWLVTRIESAEGRRVEARRLPGRRQAAPGAGQPAGPGPGAPAPASRPFVAILDLPMPEGGTGLAGVRVALRARPFMPYEIALSQGGGAFVPRGIAHAPAVMGRLVEDLRPGPFGVFDRANALTVALGSGAVSSSPVGAVLAGANLCAVATRGGAFEVLQFSDAREIEPGVFRLTTLLRGQGCTEDAAASGSAAGSVFVLLDEAVARLDLTPDAAGRAATWRVSPSGRPLDDPAAIMIEAPIGRRCLLPLSPVHLRARFDADGTMALGWVRRTRIGGDAFDAVEVPLGEEGERYRAVLRAKGSSATFETDAPALVLSAAEQTARFGIPPEEIEVEVRQLSLVQGAGAPGTLLARRPRS
ncbi:glycoside hydrolase/phage tail family protein [Aurantimonas sp. Leaf443]|uniref:baseplate multidomain protein megatron n=1 Tax=Aurantimonas sp. Leaf443 TaxID=1736378 RepID=UPI0006FBB913|nr:glycoside hydrolase/phage tail family protein [Aurantimonas sp. Leaf443]KQT88242.1 hypothetical protein ASG48_02060 [Aurantimonas sp. Leaf443]